MPSPDAVASARALLLEKATYWAGKNRQDLALDLYRRILDTAPDDPTALVGAARAALGVFNPYAADIYLAHLRSVAPDDPGLAQLERQRNRTPEEAAALANARRLAASTGHAEEAVAAYRKLMPDGTVPDELAGEFYPLLMSTLPADSVDANDALTAFGAVASKSPSNEPLQLAYAEAMVTLEGTRADGIARLRTLAKGSSVANAARAAWRTVLLWQGADFDAQAELETYLSENPSDPELEAKRKEFRESLPSEGVRARMRAYEAMRVKNMADAEKEFQAALAFDPKDVDALIMIAAIRVQQGKKAEAHAMTERAIALAPDRRDELLGIVGEDPAANARAAAVSARAVAGQYQEVARLTKQGDYDHAEEKLRKLMGSKPTAGNLVQLGDIQARAGRLDDAADTLRKATGMEPGNADAAVALATVLTRQGKPEDAAAAYAQAEDAYTNSGNRAGLLALQHSRAADLRAKAQAAQDPATQIQLLRSALAVDPSDPWLRLELARVLRKTGAVTEAQAVMVVVTPDGADPPKPVPTKRSAAKNAAAKADAASSPDDAALQAGFLWAEERGDLKQAAAFAARLPAAARTPQMVDAQARADLADDIAQAINKVDKAGTRNRLLALASQPDADGQRGAQISRAALRLGDTEGAERVIFAGLDATPNPTPPQRLRYAGVMLEANLPKVAQQLVGGLQPDQLPADQRGALPLVLDDLASAQADDLIKQGHLAEAYKLLAPRLAERPASARLNLSLSRWQTASGHPDAGLAVSVTVMKRDPSDIWARHTAIEAAIAADDLGRAQALATAALKDFPDDPYLLMQAANIARARDEKGWALDYMRKARDARRRQLATAGDSQAGGAQPSGAP